MAQEQDKSVNNWCPKLSLGGYDSIKSPEDSADWIYEHVAKSPPNLYMSEFPEEYDLRPKSQLVRHQGQRGSCAAFTASAIKEIQENKNQAWNGWMSPEFIYYHRENKPATGMFGRNVFQILQKIGSVPEHLYPYRENDDQEYVPDVKLYEIAAQYRIANFARVQTVNGLKRALLEIGPCYLLLPLFATRPNFWNAHGEETSTSGHAVTVVGYTKEGFILRNSWGITWNNDGHIIFPYCDWPIHWECWVSVDEKIKNREPRKSTRRSSRHHSIADMMTQNGLLPQKRKRKILHNCNIL